MSMRCLLMRRSSATGGATFEKETDSIPPAELGEMPLGEIPTTSRSSQPKYTSGADEAVFIQKSYWKC